MAKPRGRPVGSGKYPEDEPILREMIQALRNKDAKNEFAAATKFADRVSGPTFEARQRRLYRNLKKRRAALEAELGIEEKEEEENEEEKEFKKLMGIGIDLGDKSLSMTEANLTRRFRAAARGNLLIRRVTENLQLEGLELTPEMAKDLRVIVHYWTLYQAGRSDHIELERIHKLRERKKLQEKRPEELPSAAEQKKPDSGV